MISKKLLQVVERDLDEDSAPSDLEELTCSNLVNRKPTTHRIIRDK